MHLLFADSDAAGLVAALLSPLFFFLLNYVAALVGYDPQPDRRGGR